MYVQSSRQKTNFKKYFSGQCLQNCISSADNISMLLALQEKLKFHIIICSKVSGSIKKAFSIELYAFKQIDM